MSTLEYQGKQLRNKKNIKYLKKIAMQLQDL